GERAVPQDGSGAVVADLRNVAPCLRRYFMFGHEYGRATGQHPVVGTEVDVESLSAGTNGAPEVTRRCHPARRGEGWHKTPDINPTARRWQAMRCRSPGSISMPCGPMRTPFCNGL